MAKRRYTALELGMMKTFLTVWEEQNNRYVPISLLKTKELVK